MTAGTAGRQRSTTMVRVSTEVYDGLVEIQREIYAERHWKVSLSDIIKQMLASRKAAES